MLMLYFRPPVEMRDPAVPADLGELLASALGVGAALDPEDDRVAGGTARRSSDQRIHRAHICRA